MLAVEADYAAREAQLQEEIDNIESSHPGYDEYRYDLGMIGHDPHELAAFLSAVLQGYTRQSAQAELARVFAAQYQLTLTEEVEIRYRTETSTDPETGETTSEEVPYEYYILNVKLASKPISAVVSELLTPEQMKMYQVYRQTMGNKPLLFGGGSPDTSGSEDLSGVLPGFLRYSASIQSPFYRRMPPSLPRSLRTRSVCRCFLSPSWMPGCILPSMSSCLPSQAPSDVSYLPSFVLLLLRCPISQSVLPWNQPSMSKS